MSKANHTVTVPRDYLERLEELADNEFNMRGDLRTAKYPADASNPFPYEYKTLFVTSDNLDKVDNVIIVNKEGKELGRFSKRF